MFKRLRTVAAAAMLTVATYAAAVDTRESQPDSYVVGKGDTLWGIAARFLDKPWLWPEIWQANPQVHNPHLIYPGDVLNLAYPDRATVQHRVTVHPGPRQDAPIEAIALAQVEPFLKDLRVVDSFKQLPYVIGFEDNRPRGSLGQLTYVKGLTDAQPGQRYVVVRPSVQFSLPRLNRDLDARGDVTIATGSLWKDYVAPDARRESLGYELTQVNLATVTGGNSEVTTLLLQDSGREVRAGDRVIPVQAQAYDLRFVPHPPATPAATAGIRVLAVADGLVHSGRRDVIAISGGSREGIDNGTVFSIWRQGLRVSDRITHKHFARADDGYTGGRQSSVGLPDEYAAHAMVFRVYEKVSYALVMEAVKPTHVGYVLKHPDAH